MTYKQLHCSRFIAITVYMQLIKNLKQFLTLQAETSFNVISIYAATATTLTVKIILFRYLQF